MSDEPSPISRPARAAFPRSGGRNAKKITKKVATRGEKVFYGSVIYAVQMSWGVPQWYRSWKEYFSPVESRPNIVKSYDCRKTLPVRCVSPDSSLGVAARD
jgi:hypothetical protein